MITMVIPSIPVRASLLVRALQSVMGQTILPSDISVALDCERQGAGPVRTRAMQAARTEWLAFMDDDDELLPHHLETLYCTAMDVGADVVWPWFNVVGGGGDPIACNRGKQWDSASPHTFPITALVRTELALQCHFPVPLSDHGCSGEDFNFWIQMDRLGARFHHINEATWVWHHDSANTAGLPNRW